MSKNGTAGGNNYPLAGGKYNNFEGGIRMNSFASGGFIPAAQRGTRYTGIVAAWDWCACAALLHAPLLAPPMLAFLCPDLP